MSHLAARGNIRDYPRIYAVPEQIFEFNYERDPATALAHLEAVRSAVLILDARPRIARLTGAGSALREPVISHGESGYIALYEPAPAEHLVRIVAIRHPPSAQSRLSRQVNERTSAAAFSCKGAALSRQTAARRARIDAAFQGVCAMKSP